MVQTIEGPEPKHSLDLSLPEPEIAFMPHGILALIKAQLRSIKVIKR